VGDSVSTVPAVPSPGAPAGGSIALGTDFTWAPIAGATQYVIEVQHDGTITAYNDAIKATVACNTSQCRFIKADAAKVGTNRWRLRAENSQGLSGWSAWQNFVVGDSADVAPPVAQPETPAGVIGYSNPNYKWDAVPGASDYNIEVRDASNEVRLWVKMSAADANCPSAGDQCTWSKDDAPMTGQNRWRLRSLSASEKASEWSKFTQFEVVK